MSQAAIVNCSISLRLPPHAVQNTTGHVIPDLLGHCRTHHRMWIADRWSFLQVCKIDDALRGLCDLCTYDHICTVFYRYYELKLVRYLC